MYRNPNLYLPYEYLFNVRIMVYIITQKVNNFKKIIYSYLFLFLSQVLSFSNF